VCLQLTIHRFVCSTSDCARRIFHERLPSIADPYARRTDRLTDAFAFVGFAIGGEAGARTLTNLAMGTSPNTLLWIIRASVMPDHETPRVLGVDDFAFRCGKRYGTLFVDLERRCRVSASVFAAERYLPTVERSDSFDKEGYTYASGSLRQKRPPFTHDGPPICTSSSARSSREQRFPGLFLDVLGRITSARTSEEHSMRKAPGKQKSHSCRQGEPLLGTPLSFDDPLKSDGRVERRHSRAAPRVLQRPWGRPGRSEAFHRLDRSSWPSNCRCR
jgi:hypothetical protein